MKYNVVFASFDQLKRLTPIYPVQSAQNVTRSKFWKEIEEWVPEPKTKRMRLTQEEMTAQPEESFLPLDPYFMGKGAAHSVHHSCSL